MRAAKQRAVIGVCYVKLSDVYRLFDSLNKTFSPSFNILILKSTEVNTNIKLYFEKPWPMYF